MKKGLIIIGIFIILFSSIAFAQQGGILGYIEKFFSPSYQPLSSTLSVDENYSFQSPEFMIVNNQASGGNNTEIYYVPSITGTYIISEPGYPKIPYKTVKLLIPYGQNIEGVEISGIDKTYAGIYNLDYGKNIEPTSSLDQIINLTTSKNNQIYNLNTEYPGLNSSYEIQKLDGYSILILNIYPMQYIPSTGEVYYYKSMEVKVYTSSLSQSIAVSEASYITSNNNDIQRVKSEVDNSGQVSTYSQASSFNTESSNPSYDYIIITNRALNNSNGTYTFQDLINWKRSKGLSAGIFTVEDILSNPNYNCDGAFGDGCAESQFNDTAAHIRNFIRDMYKNYGTRYVLLGGDGDGANVGGESGNNIIPARLFYPRMSNGNQNYNDNVPSDNYYSNLDGNMDGNLNGYFGEPNDGANGGDIDLYAEVFIGRAPVDSVQEVSNFVNKTIWFENYTMHQSLNYTQVDNYLKKFLLAGEWLGFGGASDYGSTSKEEIRTGSSAYNYTTVGIPDQFGVETLYDAYQSYWSKTALMNEMNSGVQIINHLGHGSSNFVMKLCQNLGGDCTYCSDLADQDRHDLENLTNDKYFFIYSQACYPGSFDNWNYQGCYSKTDSIGENFVDMPHGAFAVIMNSRYGWGEENSTDGPGQRFDRQFFNEVFGKGNLKLGVANQYSKEDNIGGFEAQFSDPDFARALRYEYYELTLLGDPETSLYIPPSAYHNVGISGINASQTFQFKTNNTITVSIYNSENATETNLSISLLVNNNTIDTKNISYINGNTAQDINFTWFSNLGGNLTISAVISLAGDEKPWDNSYSISVYAIPFVLTGNFWDFANDTDGSGLNDTILVGVEIDSVANESDASFLGELYANNGVYINTSYSGGSYMSYNGTFISLNRVDNVNLTAGINRVWIPFYTYNMRTNNISNTLNLQYLAIYYRDSTGGHNIYSSNLGNTSFYDYREFDDLPIRLTGYFNDYPYDSNKNGKYDYLVLVEGLNVTKPGTYRIDDTIINNKTFDSSSKTISFGAAGLYNLSFPILGSVINLQNASGVFNLTSKVMVTAGTAVQTYNLDAAGYLSSNYNSNSFEGAGGYLTNNYSDQAIDINGDGIYEFLRISVGVNVTREGVFGLSYLLYNSSTRWVGSSSKTRYLKAGLQTIDLYFQSASINSNPNLAYADYFRVVNLTLSYFGIHADSRANPYNTSLYYSSNFSSASYYTSNYSELSIASMYIPVLIDENQSFLLNLSVYNQGSKKSNPFNISFFDGTILLNKVQFSGITAYNYSTNFVDYINLSAGVHTLYAVLDDEGSLDEYYPESTRVLYSNVVVGNPNSPRIGSELFISTDKNNYNVGEKVYLQ